MISIMRFQAASIGEAVPRKNFDAAVRSAFDSAVNLRLADEDRLITVLISDHYELPQGIRVLTNDIPLPSLTMGLRAASRGGILRFDSSPLSIDLRDAPVWKCRVRGFNLDMRSPAAQKAWLTAWDLLDREQRLKNADVVASDLFQPGAGSLLSQRMGKPVTQLVTATKQSDIRGAMQAVNEMIGLGAGVTPSGDDILIGFLAGLWSVTAENPRRLAFIRSLGDALVQAAGQTGEISRTYIYHAAQGQFSSALSNLVEGIGTGNGVKRAAQEAMRVGHSSGMDSATGLLIGLAVWDGSGAGLLQTEIHRIKK